MKRVLVLIALTVCFAFGLVASGAFAHDPPGRDPCSHGETGKECKPDPQPEHGKDCEHHGKHGGQNEDHCKDETQPPTETTGTTETTTTETTQPPTTTVTVTTPPGTVTETQPPSTVQTTVTQTQTETGPSVTETAPGETVTVTEETTAPTASPKPPKTPVGAPQKPKQGKKCPAGTRKFQGRCHAVIEGSG